ncbi:Lin0512 family protein [Amaricoccus tamworthensis]|uniref:Lin0512 family protein n=1 Tax=Amaricoccus tamworthensis TaxID=57002 RepID=UPI003C7CDED8
MNNDVTRVILEMGSGNSLRNRDYTKAAKRAVEEAIRHSKLTVLSSLGIDPATVAVELTIAAQEPEKVDIDAAAAVLPFGQVTARAVKGGLNVEDVTGAECVIVNAGVIVRLPNKAIAPFRA